MRIAWFSPLPPARSGIAAYSAELLPLLAARGHLIEEFTEHKARDFVWKQRRNPYDLTVFHLGNASCHDYMWAYVFRYPGLVVLHDAQLHQARALWLTRRWKPRREDYLAEFRANHPEAPPDVGELVAAGLGGSLYHHWPLIRLVVESSRLTVVHNRLLMEELGVRYPAAHFEHIEMGVRDSLHDDKGSGEKARRIRPGGDDAVVLTAFGGVTPEKRIPQLIRALGALAERHPSLQLLLVGDTVEHYDARAEADRSGVADRVHFTGYVPDSDLPSYLEASDICACLRWPTNRETSASWLRCLAAGRPTIITDLAHQGDVPTIDPRGWAKRDMRSGDERAPIAVSIELVDEDHSLQLALDRLATDASLRSSLGQAGRAWWRTHHQLDAMADGYERALRRAMQLAIPEPPLPRHLLADGAERVRAIAASLSVTERLAGLLQR